MYELGEKTSHRRTGGLLERLLPPEHKSMERHKSRRPLGVGGKVSVLIALLTLYKMEKNDKKTCFEGGKLQNDA